MDTPTLPPIRTFKKNAFVVIKDVILKHNPKITPWFPRFSRGIGYCTYSGDNPDRHLYHVLSVNFKYTDNRIKIRDDFAKLVHGQFGGDGIPFVFNISLTVRDVLDGLGLKDNYFFVSQKDEIEKRLKLTPFRYTWEANKKRFAISVNGSGQKIPYIWDKNLLDDGWFPAGRVPVTTFIKDHRRIYLTLK